MPMPVLRSLDGASLRPNPAYEAVPLAALSQREARHVMGRTSERDAAGVLRRRDADDCVLRVLDAASIELLTRHGQSGSEAQVARLVLDGALEVESSGGFVSGPAAFDDVIERFELGDGDAIARRSRAAVAHAAVLKPSEINELSVRLYCYGRRPASPRWHRAIPRRDSVADYLGFRNGLPGPVGVRAAWQAKPTNGPLDGWFSWFRRARSGRSGGYVQSYKLYVSPSPDALRDAFSLIVATLADGDAVAFKVGADVYGVLRPDKVVAYFETLTAVERAAAAVQRSLAGIAAHGVPFTAALCSDGLLSWGCDPPSVSVAPERESWRLWITNRLADALLHAKEHPHADVAADRFALARIALDGVDPDRWTPAAVAWRIASAAE